MTTELAAKDAEVTMTRHGATTAADIQRLASVGRVPPLSYLPGHFAACA